LSIDRIAGCLEYVHQRFEARGIWHCLAYGTLLGAVRDGDLIPWDYDFDLLVQPRDVDRIVALSADTAADGIAFELGVVGSTQLAVNPDRLAAVSSSSIVVRLGGERIGDLYAFSLFDDGVLRRFDEERGAYWVPHSSFAHFFVDRLESAALRGRRYPVPRRADRLLADTYGADWRTPYRAMQQGGAPKDGVTIHGDRYEPHLRAQIEWCETQGWDRGRYAHERRWPRPIRAAGPVGPTDRTRDSSRALWWRSRDELTALY
jgi:hypothetical protein